VTRRREVNAAIVVGLPLSVDPILHGTGITRLPRPAVRQAELSHRSVAG
jgi:hypothetical protein